jgi:non-homologous end joining protein Ku
VHKLLAITVLSYETQLKKPTEFEGEVPDVATGSAEVKLARTLIEASTAEEFDFGKYQDEHTHDLRKLIESKAHGKKIVAGREGAAPAIINLMDALRESLHEAKGHGRGTAVRQNGHATRRPAKTRRAPRRRKVG